MANKLMKRLGALGLSIPLLLPMGCVKKSGPVKGASPQIPITNYNETAIDAMGRMLPTSAEAGLPREDRYVGLFYFLWTGIDGSCTSTADVTKAYAQNPQKPNLPNNYCWWSEPETGYHRASDVWQIKRDMRYFAMAGVDFLYLDFTNGRTYDQTFRILLDTCLELRAAGQMTPYIVPFTRGTDEHSERESTDLGGLYRTFYSDKKYDELWFHWEDKPLVLLCTSTYVMEPDAYVDETHTLTYSDIFTFRMGWSTLNWPGQDEKNYKKWNDNCVVNYGYQYGYTNNRDIAECTGIGCAGFANPGEGRSGELSEREYLDQFLETDTMGQGLTLEKAFQEVMEKNPEVKVLLLSRWNEFVAINFGKGTNAFGFVDQFNAEFSRDMEPIKGGYTDNYFYQMCSIIRRFKGVHPADVITEKRSINLKGGFSQWQDVGPVFSDFTGDTVPRDDYDCSGKIHYTDDTGRNDIAESRLAVDGAAVSFYVRTVEPLTSCKGRNWMMLFIDADNDKTTGWEGYDFVVNYSVVDGELTTLCAYRDNVWQEIGLINYRAEGNELMLSVPRSALGLTSESFTLNFHWMDNVTDVYDLESWFTTGDSAPERRNNYSMTVKVSYDGSGASALKVRSEGAVTCMPSVSLPAEAEEALETGLDLKVYHMTSGYGKMPDFELLQAKKSESGSARVIEAQPSSLTKSSDYGLVYEGYVRVDSDGPCSFNVRCDDAARLYIDGRLVAEVAFDEFRDSGKVMNSSGELRLASGLHRFRIEYAVLSGGGSLLELDGNWTFVH